MSFAITELNVIRWGEARGIIHNGKPLGQVVKLFEESTELLDAVNKKNIDDIKDAVGDIMVVLTMLCGILDLDLTECYESAYQEIKDRKGHLTKEGIFVKQ
jgi:NTP pyrophosphatase (non-canonical NTP hydrolase)